MKTRADDAVALRLVQASLRECDPYALLAGGAPQDELDGEAVQVASHIPRLHTADDAAAFVSQVVSAAFEQRGFFSPRECAGVGLNLFSRLLEAGLVHAQRTLQADGPASGKPAAEARR